MTNEEAPVSSFRSIGIAAAAALACASCGPGSLDAMERSLEDPVAVAPSVASFEAENRIRVAWPADPRADEYLLEAASGGEADPVYTVVYRGASTGYEERDCVDQGLRLFRLSEARGSRVFGPSPAAMGVGSAVTRDAQEPNDEESSATDLGFEKSANLYHYRSFEGIELEDEDWYSIRVPPRMTAYIVLVQTNPEIAGQDSTWMSFYRRGQLPVPVKNDTAIPLCNYAYSEKTIAFKISPRAEDFLGTGKAAGGGLVDYTVKLYSISSL
jgi:hypothetical protein